MTEPSSLPVPTLELIESARLAEKEQALVYRGLSARAEVADRADLAQRFHDLHADEQHHVSRLTARLLELGLLPRELPNSTRIIVPLEGWEPHVRLREEAEKSRYLRILEEELDLDTRQLVESILEVEEHHLAELGGKWTMA